MSVTNPGNPKTVAAFLAERGWSAAQLAQAARLDENVIRAILAGQYTTSPHQRTRIAAALGVDVEAVAWSPTLEVQHLHGHGPQFGRSP